MSRTSVGASEYQFVLAMLQLRLKRNHIYEIKVLEVDRCNIRIRRVHCWFPNLWDAYIKIKISRGLGE